MKTMLFNTTLFSILVILPSLVNAQLVTLKGYITDQETESYLENVNIFESGSVIGTISNDQGYYKLTLPSGEADLSFTLDGFQDYSKQITLNHDSVFSIQLKPEISIKGEKKKKVEEEDLAASKQKVSEI